MSRTNQRACVGSCVHKTVSSHVHHLHGGALALKDCTGRSSSSNSKTLPDQQRDRTREHGSVSTAQVRQLARWPGELQRKLATTATVTITATATATSSRSLLKKISFQLLCAGLRGEIEAIPVTVLRGTSTMRRHCSTQQTVRSTADISKMDLTTTSRPHPRIDHSIIKTHG